MDTVFRVFMFLLPYAICIAAYIWVGTKAWRTKNIISKIIALAFVAGGLGYTLYKLARTIRGIATSDDFEFVIIIIMVFVLFFASIAIAVGEPEKK